MKIGVRTLALLKNYSGINPSIIFHKGNVIRTMSPQKTVISKATIEEDIPSTAGIHDISRFTASLSIMNNPDIQFGEKKFTIVGEKSGKIHYTYTAPEMIVAAPLKDYELENVEAVIDMPWSEIDNLRNAAGVLQLPEIAFEARDGRLIVKAFDSGDNTADNYEIDVAEIDKDKKFLMKIKTESVKLMPLDYKISLSAAGVIHFKTENLEYWIAVQQ